MRRAEFFGGPWDGKQVVWMFLPPDVYVPTGPQIPTMADPADHAPAAGPKWKAHYYVIGPPKSDGTFTYQYIGLRRQP